ncbi:valine--tRNA ligase [Candidatus Woesearchaeota archaeon]|jgi:valyl-tRNA synthetase|nr:valine--tRNA ligase [Candidatus Woesearchaeota archaeon]MBT3438847.1 valine--tRNA ligase [Candidatus Woesearchaeota archaeon]MBT4058554.1 valine--tRNA ligase [Candidatus Woesearchaeota archaeon]MBT4208679.1 valine--tRNA ligase [Candidatus Woesearchaeota archaeon]MBT4732642.1 valine--tRNA ligase [Candidatus Woesearchaeota archaeon]
MKVDMSGKYLAEEIEKKWMARWEKDKTYKFDETNADNIFSIDTPPPTVSGKLHFGHAFSSSQQDFIARYKRMNGFNVLQPFGTDDNGLPTQTLIEKLKKVWAKGMERKEFIELCLNTLENELRPSYLQDWKRLGMSCDFDVNYTTINEHSIRLSQKSFIELYEMGRAYRQEAPATWCPKCQTAIAQVELEDKEIPSIFNDIVFMVGDEKLTVATTRPELLPACVAIFYHPDDTRYSVLEGKLARVPLFDFEVPILPDERADPEKGTGIVMCCTFGDSTDVEWQKAHKLPIKTAINKDGTMSSLAGKYEGMKLKKARTEIIEDLKNENLLTKQEPITHSVNTHERCGTEIEFVHSKQWFIRYLDLKDDMLEWGNELNWYPKHMKNRYDNWVKGLQWDWCISRQISFGVPFPIWYCGDCGETIVASVKNLPVYPLHDKAPVDCCPNCKSKNLKGEKDVINTWATSSLTPTIVKELFKGTEVYNYLKENPMDLRTQGHDIISFWLFNTVVKSRLHEKMNPWKDCFINGWVLDPRGRKMSKSKGNVVEPQKIIETYSADALRIMAGGCKLGDDFPYQEKDVKSGQKTVTKLWNASKFVFMHLEDFEHAGKDYDPEKLELMDKWLLLKLNKVINHATDAFEIYEFSKAKKEIDGFFWNALCDNYLEIVKDRLYNPDTRGELERLSGQHTLYGVLLNVLKLFAPIAPFITEEIHDSYYAKMENKGSIHKRSWPEVDSSFDDEEIEKSGDKIVELLGEVRKFKSEQGKSLKEPVSIVVSEEDFSLIEKGLDDFKAATNAKSVESGKEFSVSF